jgi:hypothetical protein
MSEQQENCKVCPEGLVRDAKGQCVMPDVTFSSFILSLNTSALFHLGELTHPETGQREFDLGLAKHSIDSIAMLQSKTKGNLDQDETELVSRVLYDLQIRYAKKAGGLD